MRTPPPVQFPSSGGAGWRAVRAAGVTAGVVVPLAWALPWLADPWSSWVHASLGDAAPAAWLSTALAAGAVAWRRLRETGPRPLLRWDGTGWSLAADEAAAWQPGRATLMVDLDGWMLVRFRPDARRDTPPAWLPLRRASAPVRWTALRAALWNGRSPPPGPAA